MFYNLASNTSTQRASNMDAIIDKKLAEKKQSLNQSNNIATKKASLAGKK